jgi:phage gp36-like protein
MSDITRVDLETFGMSAAAVEELENCTPGAVARFISAGKAIAEGYLRAAYSGPVTYGDDVKLNTCAIIAYQMLVSLGLRPDAPDHVLIKERYAHAIRWFEQVAAKKIHPLLIEGSTPQNGAVVLSEDNRGWYSVTIKENRGW